MSTSLRADLLRRLCLNAIFIATAMILSYVEVLIPFGLLIPLPGFKLGLANTVTILVFVLLSKKDAFLVSALRILLMGILFGSATSLFFSALGGCFAYLALLLASVCLHRCSYIGLSVFCAVAHQLGQILAAVCLFGWQIFLSYFPVLLPAALLSGFLTGFLLNRSIPILQRSIHA